ncbi:MAG: hypothetical protein ACREIQ_10515 [Nitrospiria bacterium]
MRKAILVFWVGLIVFFSALPVFAADLKVNGDFRIRGFYTDNLTDQSDTEDDASAYNSMRFLLTTKASAGLATGVVTMDFTSTHNTGNQRFGGGQSYGPQDDTFALLEAYIKADLRMATLSAGRQMFKMGHGIIFDDPVDGFFLEMPVGPAKLTLAGMKPFDCSGLTTSNDPAIAATCSGGSGTGNDTDIYFGNIGIRPTADFAGNLFFALYKDRGPNILPFNINTGLPVSYPLGTSSVDLWVLGYSGDGKVGPINLTGEIDYLTGDFNNNSVNADLEGLNAQLGGNTNVGAANVGLTLLYASGQDSSNANDVNTNGIDGNFPTGIILTNGGARSLAPKDGTCLSVNGDSLGGIPNCYAGSGLKAIKGTGSISPVERLNLQADIIYAKASGAQYGGGSTNIGWELDGTARYKLDDNFTLMTGIGYLVAGDFWKPTSPSDPTPDDMIVIVGEMSFHF